ncbi:hypothetical protein SAMN04488137_2579 [Fictibacillus solisalsi]|uniref:Uncharacterized protein n=1 Tax=Fictibacillus solisalsi TaxID=459525 RepID=A0A1G9X6C7_9BACL|nr:hypothetical protein [Fictibacillus solisalsi]SDM91895.1 hypothetical protein SAMN04488137_2579 [Fictibacillus solisalsi]
MDQFWQLIVLVSKLLWAKAAAGSFALSVLAEAVFQNFWVQFASAIVVVMVLVKLIEFSIRYYYYHNFVHRKLKNSLGAPADLDLFFQTTMKRDISRGLLPNLRFMRSLFLQMRRTELRLFHTYLRTNIRTLKGGKPIGYAVGILIGLFTSFAMDILKINNLAFSQESTVKTVLLVVVWFIIVHLWMNKRIRSFTQLDGIVLACLNEKLTDPFDPEEETDDDLLFEERMMKEHS